MNVNLQKNVYHEYFVVDSLFAMGLQYYSILVIVLKGVLLVLLEDWASAFFTVPKGGLDNAGSVVMFVFRISVLSFSPFDLFVRVELIWLWSKSSVNEFNSGVPLWVLKNWENGTLQ